VTNDFDLEKLLNDMALECFGYDWYDFRDRYNKWVEAHPEHAHQLVETAVEFLRRHAR
jgi:hypothetical protein